MPRNESDKDGITFEQKPDQPKQLRRMPHIYSTKELEAASIAHVGAAIGGYMMLGRESIAAVIAGMAAGIIISSAGYQGIRSLSKE